jgi:hypothetical protein
MLLHPGGEVFPHGDVELPPLAEQTEIVRRVNELFALADTIERRVAAATARAEKLTQSILAKAFRGELAPTEAESARQEGRDYEPASVLLERIRAKRAASEAKPARRQQRKAGQAAMKARFEAFLTEQGFLPLEAGDRWKQHPLAHPPPPDGARRRAEREGLLAQWALSIGDQSSTLTRRLGCRIP